jgi:hypothetical protein
MIFLGHVISIKGIFMDLRKIKTVLKWERPTNMIKIYSFLRLAGYCRKFIEGYFTIVIPMT